MDDNPFTSPPSNPSTDGADSSPKDKSENTLGILCHLLGLGTFVIPFGNIIGPLILWLLKRADSPYLDETGKEALNFNISWTIYTVIAALSFFVLIGFVLFPLVFLAWLILVVVASIKASEGKIYRYPLTIRLIK